MTHDTISLDTGNSLRKGGVSWWLVGASVLFAIVAVALLRLLWNRAIRRYSSVSS